MANGNGTSKWIIGIAVSIALAVGGWGTTAVLATRNAMLSEMRDEVRKTRELADSTDRRVYTLEEQYRSIMAGIAELKTQLKEHTR